MEPIVQIKNYGSFTNEHLNTAKNLLNKEAHPHLYPTKAGDNPDSPSLVYIDTILIDSNSIERKTIHGHEQEVRVGGLNPNIQQLRNSINDCGWLLWAFPISVREVDGKYYFLDGRTKDIILQERSFKNRIVNVYKCDDIDALNTGLDANMSTTPPAGKAKETDIVQAGCYAILSGLLEYDEESILSWVNRICKRSSVTKKKRDQLRWKIFHNVTNKNGILPRAWINSGEVSTWLKTHNFIDNQKVMYLPFAASSPSKAIFAAAEASLENPNTEIRIVLYISKLEGYDLRQCYVNSVLRFKRIFHSKLNSLSLVYFSGSTPQNVKVKLYGVVPSNIEDICDNMDEMIIFGKNDANISQKYLDNLKLNSYFEIENNDEDDEMD